MGGKEAVPFRLVRAENVYGFNGKERSLKKEHNRSTGYGEGKKKEMEPLCRLGGKLWRSGQGGSWYHSMELQGFVISVL